MPSMIDGATNTLRSELSDLIGQTYEGLDQNQCNTLSRRRLLFCTAGVIKNAYNETVRPQMCWEHTSMVMSQESKLKGSQLGSMATVLSRASSKHFCTE
eukprot:scaffold92089_cov19-Prasinocladus_malaysianus.AAC.1